MWKPGICRAFFIPEIADDKISRLVRTTDCRAVAACPAGSGHSYLALNLNLSRADSSFEGRIFLEGLV